MRLHLGRRLVLLVWSVLIIVPLVVVVLGSLKTTRELFASPFGVPSGLRLRNYHDVVVTGGLGTAFANSCIVTVCSVALTLLLASLAAYGIARIPGWRGWLIFGFLVLGMSVPAQANMIPQYVLFKSLGLTNSLVGLVLINVVSTLPVAVFILTGFMRTLPGELYEASSLDGSGPLRTYASVIMPLSVPSVAAAAIFLFVIHWNELIYPLLFINDPAKRTIPLALLNFQGEFLTNYPVLFSGVIIASVPIVAAYVFLQRFFIAGITAGASKG